jgi:hypothetical protein
MLKRPACWTLEHFAKSDHRGVFLTLIYRASLGTPPERLAPPHFRKLKLDDPRISYSYRCTLHRQFELNNVYQRMNTISLRGGGAEDQLLDDGAF